MDKTKVQLSASCTGGDFISVKETIFFYSEKN